MSLLHAEWMAIVCEYRRVTSDRTGVYWAASVTSQRSQGLVILI